MAGGLVSVLKSFKSSNHVGGDGIIRQKNEAFPEKNTQVNLIVLKRCISSDIFSTIDNLYMSSFKSLIKT